MEFTDLDSDCHMGEVVVRLSSYTTTTHIQDTGENRQQSHLDRQIPHHVSISLHRKTSSTPLASMGLMDFDISCF
jgi:hypothetical protein